jgi:hypothetical protein
MAVRDVLTIGDPRLRLMSAPVERFDDPALPQLLDDLRDTMAATDGAGLAAPQIGVPLRVVIFGITANPRYPEAPPHPGDGADQSRAHPPWRRTGHRRLGGLPERARLAGPGAPLAPPALPGLRRPGATY